MSDLEKAEAAVRVAYIDEAIHYKQAKERFACATAEDRVAIAKANAQARVAIEQRIIEAEAKLKEVMSIESKNVNIS